jgi:hypothetical protein
MAGERVHGVGGLFVRADDPDTLRQWYADVLGVIDSPDGVWHQPAGPTVFAAFSRASEYFPLQQQCMVNFRVANLDAMLGQLEAPTSRCSGREISPAWDASPGSPTRRATESSSGSRPPVRDPWNGGAEPLSPPSSTDSTGVMSAAGDPEFPDSRRPPWRECQETRP